VAALAAAGFAVLAVVALVALVDAAALPAAAALVPAALAVPLAVRAAVAVAVRAAFAVLAVTSRATLAPRAALSPAARVRDGVRAAGAVVRDFTGAVTGADAAAVREVVPGACERVRRVPGEGAAPSVVRRSGWSGVMHLASVGDILSALPGKRRREPCKHAVTVS
jgi:hypothetical protein